MSAESSAEIIRRMASKGVAEVDARGPNARLVAAWNLEWLNSGKGHWGDRIDWTSAREIARRLDEAAS